MTDKALCGKPPGRAGHRADTEGLRQFGLAAAMALLAGSIFVKFAALAFMAPSRKRPRPEREMSWLP